jgi:ribosome recycling factor
MSPLNQVASIKVPEARTIVIEPWDKSVLHEIEKVLANSDLGVTPTNDGQVIRINLPALTEENRDKLAKTASQKAEESKAHLRSIRTKIKDQLKELDLPEDDQKREEKQMQDEFDAFTAKIDEIKDEKVKEIMAI